MKSGEIVMYFEEIITRRNPSLVTGAEPAAPLPAGAQPPASDTDYGYGF